ncbi:MULTISPECIES: hypothetical protein [unclassified Myroides]|uniref:hypothetical protein n=1 Tax=unclassified Myroides TaxID=2642485 RepID=UPI003D2F8D85
MQKKITIDDLDQIALEASQRKYRSILSKLEKTAHKGRNSIIITELSEILINKLRKEGYTVTAHFTIKSSFLFKKKIVKHYQIRFRK